MQPNRTTISTTAYALGFAGLLPQALAVLAIATAAPIAVAAARVAAEAYALSILSFLGGIWWGFAMRRGAAGGRLAIVAVVPSLVGVAIVLAIFAGLPERWALVALGSAILLALPVDRSLAVSGDAPGDWLRLRRPLSIGLGALTILAGALRS